MHKVLFSGLLALSIAAAGHASAMGANKDARLKEVIAFAAGQVGTENVVLLSVKRTPFSVTWTGQAPAGTYLCRSDDMLRNPQCKKLEEIKTASAN